MSILYCGLNRTEYNRISSCTTSTEIWMRLEVTHEGTDEVKQTRIRTLTRIYENFKMLPDEDIDSFFTRFADIINPLMSLGRTFTQAELVSKELFLAVKLLYFPMDLKRLENSQKNYNSF